MKTRISRHKNKIKTVVFLLLLSAVVMRLQYYFCIRDYGIYTKETLLASEKIGEPDAVYVGASHVFRFFSPPFAWNQHGITVFSYSMASMRGSAIKYKIIEARKHYPDALYIVNLNSFKNELDPKPRDIHSSVDFMGISANKVALIRKLTENVGFTGSMEYFFPIIRFHSGWPDMTMQDFVHPVFEDMGANLYKPFLAEVEDKTSRFQEIQPDPEASLSEENTALLTDLMDYVKSENIRILFVIVPQALNEDPLSQVYAAERIVREEGFDCINLREKMDEIGIQAYEDFEDNHHTNIHGSLKFTDYFSRFLADTYGFENKKDRPGYEIWDNSYTSYSEEIAPYTLDLEREYYPRDYSLAVPVLTGVSQNGQEITLTFEGSEGADGYVVYRKLSSGSGWERVSGDLEDVDSYTEQAGAAGTYTYTVVPYMIQDGVQKYGNFDYIGISLAVAEAS